MEVPLATSRESVADMLVADSSRLITMKVNAGVFEERRMHFMMGTLSPMLTSKRCRKIVRQGQWFIVPLRERAEKWTGVEYEYDQQCRHLISVVLYLTSIPPSG